jgi:prepilin-type processing-associated H-X9-DG protein/prepilin-type N-terminal cleavage/methylation domain-containing protein
MRQFDILQQRNRGRRGGFNIFELLVALAVITILACFIMPVFFSARDKTRRETCQTNLKQMGLGVMQYVRDYDENFPLAVTGAPETSTSQLPCKGWGDAIQPYLKSTRLYQCPSEPGGANPDPLSVGYSDYWYNCALSWNGKSGKAARWNSKVQIARFVTPAARVVMFGDAGRTNGSGTARTRTNGYRSTGSSFLSSPDMLTSAGRKVNRTGFAEGGQRHLGGLNIAFTDGHAKWFPSLGPDESAIIYNINTPLSVSKQSPTFNVVKK